MPRLNGTGLFKQCSRSPRYISEKLLQEKSNFGCLLFDPHPCHAHRSKENDQEVPALTKLLNKAFAEATQLPDDQQDSVGAWILAELASERRWDEAFARSADQLAELADAALREYKQGKTEELDPDQL